MNIKEIIYYDNNNHMKIYKLPKDRCIFGIWIYEKTISITFYAYATLTIDKNPEAPIQFR
ncbi:MAG: hypothetical protein LUI60_01140 [Clostridia bacterium]|nr:hypothetical protein [Clostridia bacterium]